MRLASVAVFIAVSAALVSAQDPPKNIWDRQYKERSAESMAQQFESWSRPVYRYRVAIVDLLRLKPGMSVAEIGAGSGFLARLIAERVGADGRVVATELEEKMVAHMAGRAKAEGLTNFTAVRGQPGATGLEAGAFDAVAMVNVYSFLDQPDPMLRSAAGALKPGGLLLIVDYPRTGQGAERTGVDAEDVIAAAATAGFEHVDEVGIVPGHFALRFKKAGPTQ
jgi:ubiquinone/menaquinone biosynthesis C-methylase UbiE